MKEYLKEFRYLKGYYFLLPILVAGYFLFVHFARPEVVILVGKEDSFIEWLSFISLAGASFAYLLCFKKYRNYFFLLLFLLMFFGAGEEISWGQRIFGFSTPNTIKKINTQGEFTIHNLEIFSGKQFDHKSRQGWHRLLKMDLWFKVFIFSFGIGLPLATYHLKSVASFTKKIKLPIPPISIGIFFLLAWIIRGIAFQNISLVPGENLHQLYMLKFATTEIFEFLAEFILFIISLYFYRMKFEDFIGKDIKQAI